MTPRLKFRTIDHNRQGMPVKFAQLETGSYFNFCLLDISGCFLRLEYFVDFPTRYKRRLKAYSPAANTDGFNQNLANLTDMLELTRQSRGIRPGDSRLLFFLCWASWLMFFGSIAAGKRPQHRLRLIATWAAGCGQCEFL